MEGLDDGMSEGIVEDGSALGSSEGACIRESMPLVSMHFTLHVTGHFDLLIFSMNDEHFLFKKHPLVIYNSHKFFYSTVIFLDGAIIP